MIKTAALLCCIGSLATAINVREKDVTGLCGRTKSGAGYVTIDSATDKNYFYWYFNSRSKPSTDPVILWMTGGPGCSSELALLHENGPCELNKAGTATLENIYGWNNKANIVYIDQPADVGFSYGTQAGWDHNEKQVSQDMYTFLQGFFQKHPEWLSNEFYVFGESYGGHFAPATAHRILVGNLNGEGLKINLQGLAVGNGLTDPLIQYKYYPEMAGNYSEKKIGHAVLSQSTIDSMVSGWPQCQAMIKQCQSDNDECPTAQAYCNDLMLSPYDAAGLNPYDIRKQCTYKPLCYDFNNVDTWLANSTVLDALGVTGHKWEVCNFDVNAGFSKDWMTDYQQDVSALLGNNTRVLIYAGDVDYVCNWLGNKAWTLALPWSGQSAYNSAADNTWSVAGSPAGESRSADGFTFMRVYNAGHMVPADQPAAALSMVNTFISGGSFP